MAQRPRPFEDQRRLQEAGNHDVSDGYGDKFTNREENGPASERSYDSDSYQKDCNERGDDNRRGCDKVTDPIWETRKDGGSWEGRKGGWNDRGDNWSDRSDNWNDRKESWNDRQHSRRDNWNDRRENWNKRRDDEGRSRDRRRSDSRDDRAESGRRGNDDDSREDRRFRERSRERRYRRSSSDRDRDEYRERDRDNYRSRDWRSPQRDRSKKRWSPMRWRGNSEERSPPSYLPDPNTHQSGEWICRCGALNFKRRVSCYRQHCGANRNDAVSIVRADGSMPIDSQKPTTAPIPPVQSYTLSDVPHLAAYSAQLYASNPQEQAAYLKYYTTYYTQQLSTTQVPSSDLDKVNAAAAVAQSAINQLQARVPVTAPPTGTDNRMYPIPDVSTYMYDETSGYYYDPVTGLYYDPNTQYYFNNQINQYLYWDITKYTYVLASSLQGTAQNPITPVPTTMPVTSITEPPVDDKKKQVEKTDKVKVAKKIAKDMERWAKTLNQKKEYAKSGFVSEASNISSKASASADIGFSVLEQRVPVTNALVVPQPPQPGTLVPSYGGGSDSSGDESENIIDWTKLACLLCKRQFPSREVLEKHQLMSELHKQNLGALESRKSSQKTKNDGYRDRAAERRMKYGEDDPPIMRTSRPDPIVSSVPQEIGEENIGNKLLQKMGWSAGQGLGKEGQGRIGPVEAATGGLGRKKGIYTAGPGETYRGCVKKLTMARYQDLVGAETNT